MRSRLIGDRPATVPVFSTFPHSCRGLMSATKDKVTGGRPVTGEEAVTVVIAGEPVAKARPRATRRGLVYTPAHVRKYEAHGRLAAQQAMDGRPPITVPARAEITVDLPVPASWSGRRRDAALRGDVRPTSRPDTDNYIKTELDAIQAIVVGHYSTVCGH